jgi:predicted dehydrogenase
MSRYTTVLVGCGPRGVMHARAILANQDRLQLSAVCDLDGGRLGTLAAEFGVDRTYTDVEAMLAAEQPDVLCFATMPAVRLPLVEVGVKHGVKAIACEKPMALSLAEAKRITDLCAAAEVTMIVCHQLKYSPHWQQARDIVRSGVLGEVHTIHATARPSLLRVGTHLMDAMQWLNDWQPGIWVLGQVHGAAAYAEDHPCPDHVSGTVHFANGVRGILECGTLAPQHMGDDDFWLDVMLAVYGSRGCVRAGLGTGWRAVTAASGEASGPADLTPQEPQFLRELADCLDDPQREHACNAEISYHGFELLTGMLLSSLERRRVDLPITPLPAEPVLQRLERALTGKV